jgi:YD repeat-containing protein
MGGWYSNFFVDIDGSGCADGYTRQADRSCVPSTPEVKACPISHPVYPGTGTKTLTERDDAGNEELPISRTYRSDLRFRTNGAAGGWTFNWQRGLDVAVVGNYTSSPITALRDGGTVRVFAKSGTVWTTPGVHDTIEHVGETWVYKVPTEGTEETYDAKGNLLSVRERSGRTTALQYTTTGQLSKIVAPSGRSLTFAYNAQGRVSSITAPDGAVTQYAYNANGMLTTVTWPDNTTRQYVYEDTRFPTALTGVIDEAGVRYATYAYDDQGRAITSELTAGADRYQFQYQANGQTTVLTPDGGSSTYSFLKQNGVLLPTGVSAPCPLCGSTSQSTEYDTSGNATRRVGYDGSATTYTYDAQGRETKRIVGDGTANAKTTTTEWHPTLRLPTRIISPGRNDALAYDESGRATSYNWYYTDDATGSMGSAAHQSGPVHALSWSYNDAGQIALVVEKLDAVETGRWSFSYDASGSLVSVTDGAGRTGRVNAFDAAGRPVDVVNTKGEHIRYQYNARGQATSYDKDGRVFNYDYNVFGQLIAIRGPDNFYIGYEYDAAHQLVALLRPADAPDTSVETADSVTPFAATSSDSSRTASSTRLGFWARLRVLLNKWIGSLIGDAQAQVPVMTRIPVMPLPGYNVGDTASNSDPANMIDPSIGQRRDPSQVIRAQLGNVLNSVWKSIQGTAQAIASICHMGSDANADTGQRPSKTPNQGTPGSKYKNPGSGQERWYGDDGKPSKDVDYDHDHGQGVPHVHDWYRDANGNPVRGPGRPYDPKIDS